MKLNIINEYSQNLCGVKQVEVCMMFKKINAEYSNPQNKL